MTAGRPTRAQQGNCVASADGGSAGERIRLTLGRETAAERRDLIEGLAGAAA